MRYRITDEPLLDSKADMIVITTNGKLDAAQMQAKLQVGIAYQASQRWPWLSRAIASEVLEGKNPGMYKLSGTAQWVFGFVAFPIPPEKPRRDSKDHYVGVLQSRFGDRHDDTASPALIGFSLLSMILWLQLSERTYRVKTVSMQFPGIGTFGQLDVEVVAPLLHVLDERFTVHLNSVKGE